MKMLLQALFAVLTISAGCGPTRFGQLCASASPVGSSTVKYADSKLVVVARYDEDTSWVDFGPDSVRHITYSAGNVWAEHRPPANRGNEATSYITAIIDHYEDLPDAMMFLHGHRRGWHDTLAPSDWVVRYAKWPIDPQYPYIAVQCPVVATTNIGIRPTNPSSVRSFDPRRSKAPLRSRQFAAAWELLFKDYFGPMPDQVAGPCCSEFMVTREAILKLPKEFYINVRNWLLTTPLEADASGRILEYMWHVMFTPDHAPIYTNIPNCTCHMYGLNCHGQPNDPAMLEHMYSVPLPPEAGMRRLTICADVVVWFGVFLTAYVLAYSVISKRKKCSSQDLIKASF